MGGTVARQGTIAQPVAYAVPPHFPVSREPVRALSPRSKGGYSALRGTPSRSRLLNGRLGAIFFAGSGTLVLLTLPVPVPGLNVVVMTAVSVAAFGVAIAAWLAPWDRWSPRASLVLLAPALVLIAVSNAYGLPGLQPYGVFLFVAFVWLGMAHRPRTSIAVAPLAALAYVLPWLHLHGSVGARVYSTALTVPLCVLVGEGIARTAARLERMERALRLEKDQTERLRELDEMKDRFLSAVSHELRNPITICRGHLDVLREGAGEREVRSVKETLITELDLMTRLVEDLTTLARIDDRTQLRMELLRLDRFMDGIARQAEPILGRRLRTGPGVPGAAFRADPQRLSQALLNLLRNAAEHAGEGPVRLRVRAEPADWRFEVTDEGGGLPSGQEQAVFEPFQTGSPGTGGTGLGLSIVRGIARAHGGESGVVNRPGRGATFWIRIPR